MAGINTALINQGNKISRSICFGVLAFMASLLLMLGIPLMHYLSSDTKAEPKLLTLSNLSIKKLEKPKEKPKEKRLLKKPERERPQRLRMMQGPRFAMDLSVEGPGAGAPMGSSHGGNAYGQGEVDERPRSIRPIDDFFDIPRVVESEELHAYARISFCVDAVGNPYQLKVLDEKPLRMGMADAGRQALLKARFYPALLDGKSIAFCGLEQEFEVKFDD